MRDALTAQQARPVGGGEPGTGLPCLPVLVRGTFPGELAEGLVGGAFGPLAGPGRIADWQRLEPVIRDFRGAGSGIRPALQAGGQAGVRGQPGCGGQVEPGRLADQVMTEPPPVRGGYHASGRRLVQIGEDVRHRTVRYLGQRRGIKLAAQCSGGRDQLPARPAQPRQPRPDGVQDGLGQCTAGVAGKAAQLGDEERVPARALADEYGQLCWHGRARDEVELPLDPRLRQAHQPDPGQVRLPRERRQRR